MNRRSLFAALGVPATVTVAPRHVLGGPGHVPPSEKLVMGLIGCGTMGLTELFECLHDPRIHVVAVCDPNTESTDYVEWSRDAVRSNIAAGLGKPGWRARTKGVPGGREVGREIVDLYYGSNNAEGKSKGCAAYADFREMLSKEADLDVVKIMTPDHLHATVAIAAMKANRHVLMHKPLANRVQEARLVMETARRTGMGTHFIPSAAGDPMKVALQWIREGAIGALRQIHNWSSRPVWPQCATMPTEFPPVPKGFDWDLWLGPCPHRPYHPHYAHSLFRGWYEFGGGAISDMGHYSLWPIFEEYDLEAPVMVESTPSHAYAVQDQVCVPIYNDYSFPSACTVHFRFAAKAGRPALDFYWYDGGIKPQLPDEMEEKEFWTDGILFVGDHGKIHADFMGDHPRIIPERKFQAFKASKKSDTPLEPAPRPPFATMNTQWIEAFRNRKSTSGCFLKAGPVTEAINLAAISLRMGGKRLLWDSQSMKITNLPEANRFLTREYRRGWELKP